MSPPERITHVGGYESSQWKMPLDDAIAKIESGEREFFVQAHRRTVGVIVAVSPSGKKYLKAEADGDQPDSLLLLLRHKFLTARAFDDRRGAAWAS